MGISAVRGRTVFRQGGFLPLKGLCRQGCGSPTGLLFGPRCWCLFLLMAVGPTLDQEPGLQLFISKNYFWIQLWLLCVSHGHFTI